MTLPTSLATPAAAAMACALACGNAAAQADADAGFNTATGAKYTLGLGVVSRAKYPGSGERQTLALPLFSVNYGRFFIGGLPDAGIPLGVGATLWQQDGWRIGLGLGADLEKPRKESDASRLAGLGDIDATVSGSAFASYDAGPFVARGNVVTDLGGKGQGTRINLDLEARYSPLPRLRLSAGPGLTWADRKYTQTFFGVSAGQSAASGLAQHDADAGLNAVRFDVGATYQLTPKWGLGARASVSSLRGDAADSPITEKKTQTTYGLFTTYRF